MWFFSSFLHLFILYYFSSVLTIIFLSLPPVSKFCKTSKDPCKCHSLQPLTFAWMLYIGEIFFFWKPMLWFRSYTVHWFPLFYWECPCVWAWCVDVYMSFLCICLCGQDLSDLPFPSMTAQYYIFNLVVHGTIYWEKRYMALITFFHFILSQIVFTN